VTIGGRAALLLLGIAAIAAGGCGGGDPESPAALSLEREDLIAVTRALQRAEGSVRKEVAAARTAWPLLANGLPAHTALASPPVKAAGESAARLTVPTLFGEREAASLTGPASALAGLFRTFSGLATRGWQLIGAAIEQSEHGPPAAARFAHTNVALYIESIYDGHFSLAQIGKQLLAGYQKLGGPSTFGTSLTMQEVEGLARTYSEASDRLHPHVGVRLGS
jgi:hypothetical protein